MNWKSKWFPIVNCAIYVYHSLQYFHGLRFFLCSCRSALTWLFKPIFFLPNYSVKLTIYIFDISSADYKEPTNRIRTKTETEKNLFIIIEEYAKWWMKRISDNTEQHLISMLEVFLYSPLTVFGSFTFYLEFCRILASIKRNTKNTS